MGSQNSGTMGTSPLLDLQQMGQSVWCDSISRSLLDSGELRRMIAEDGLRGVTSNPSIFEKAISGGTDYDREIRTMARAGFSAERIYEVLAIKDIQGAADQFGALFEATGGGDGYVSLEVSPHLAYRTRDTVEEARRLWQAVARPNVMIKVPATPDGMPAIRQLLGEGINVNITLMFSMEHYLQVAEAYLQGIETLAACAHPVPAASVASFFVSRVDSVVDKLLQERELRAGTPAARERCRKLLGRAAVANTRLVYQKFREIFSGSRFLRLKQKGFRVQRPLWASTSTKNPSYSDVMYPEALIGPDTVDTMPDATLAAFLEHGAAGRTIDCQVDEAEKTLEELETAGIGMAEVTDRLLADGLRQFAESYDGLLANIEEKSQLLAKSR
jgi:transaldolase